MTRFRLNQLTLAALVLWLIGAWAFLLPSAIHAQSGPTATPINPAAQITSPAEGTPLFGVVRIIGTANPPGMQSYRLEFLAQADPRGQWQAIAEPVSQQVSNGTLGQWDTTKLADGAYQLRLRVTLRNGQVLEGYVHSLTIANQQPTPLPSVPPPPTATGLPTAGPSPTALIQQPPTATFAPSPTAFIGITPTDASSSSSAAGSSDLSASPSASDSASGSTSANSSDSGVPATTADAGAVTLSLAAIEGAACSGVLIALIGFALVGMYILLRTRLRLQK